MDKERSKPKSDNNLSEEDQKRIEKELSELFDEFAELVDKKNSLKSEADKEQS